MTSDQNKSLDSIVYNYLNLPQQINISTDGNNEINYLYTANGQKLMKQTKIENAVEQTVDYIGNFVYEANVLKFILTGEGRVVVNSGGTYEYQYSLKDHLGNTRITFNQNGQIIQEDAYYPFGMKMNGLCYETGEDYKNKYLYNGKELQDDFGLDWYDYGARFYDPQIGRWHVPDPASEISRRWSPYSYCYNNPIRFVDPDGMVVGDFYNKHWEYLGTDGNDDKKVYVVTNKKDEKTIKSNAKTGNTTQVSEVASSVELPSAYVRSKMGDAVDRSNATTTDDTKGGFHEEGGVFGTKNGQDWVAEAKPVPVADPSKGEDAEINEFDLKEGQTIPSATAEGTYHVHPSGEIETSPSSGTFGGGKIFNFNQSPSGVVGGTKGDIPVAASRSSYVTGNSYVLGARSGVVTIYNGNGTVASFPLDKFRTIGVK